MDGDEDRGEDWRGRLKALPTTRTCAGCELCCTVMGVKELGKAPWRPCVYLGATGGCGVWGAHPDSCKRFTCLWRSSDDLVPAELFPPDCGFLLALDQVERWPTVVKVCPDAARPLAWDTAANRRLFARLAAAWNCPVVVLEQGAHGVLAFAPNGRVYTRERDADVFPQHGRSLAVPGEDYDEDRRAPAERIAQAAFSWRAGA